MKSVKLNNYQLLRNQIYSNLSRQIQNNIIKPGSALSIKLIESQFNASRTPIREALLQLQAEGFVTILPQRGIIINKLFLKDVKNIYEILGGLESRVLISVFDKIGQSEICRLKQINSKMYGYISGTTSAETRAYYDLNLLFHGVFLDLSNNKEIIDFIKIKKKRLYDFTNINYGKRWKEENYKEHEQLITMIEGGDKIGAATFLRDNHWIVNEKILTVGDG